MSQLERSVLQQKLNKHCKKKCIYKVMPLEILYFMEDEYSVFYILVLSETGFISLQSKRLSRVFSSTTVQKHQWNCRKTKTQKQKMKDVSKETSWSLPKCLLYFQPKDTDIQFMACLESAAMTFLGSTGESQNLVPVCQQSVSCFASPTRCVNTS